MIGRGIDDWKSARTILNYRTLFAPWAGKGIRGTGPEFARASPCIY